MNARLQKIYDSNESNWKCCDCLSKLEDPWASLNHATFICIKCSGVHRGFGMHISFVRSTSLGKLYLSVFTRFSLFLESFGK